MGAMIRNKVAILVGDVRQKLESLPDESVHCVVTSPPYWGLRTYKGDPGMIGLEPTFEEHLSTMVEVFREVRRVLRKDGTVWLNYGDCYKNKQLMMMPSKVAIALQDDGWNLRSEIIWHKSNPMPESSPDRPTSAHEKVFLFSKYPRYFYDAVAVRTASAKSTVARFGGDGTSPNFRNGTFGITEHKLDTVFSGKSKETSEKTAGANLRNVWKIASFPYKEAHFATFPPKLAMTCIKAGTSLMGVCVGCGAPWGRVLTKKFVKSGKDRDHISGGENSAGWEGVPRGSTAPVTEGWEPSCNCEGKGRKPAVVLDPFAGSGTVAVVATRTGRDCLLVDISREYAEMAKARITKDVARPVSIKIL